MGVQTPKDLGISYTQEDFNSAMDKTGIELLALPEGSTGENAWKTEGSKDINISLTSEEITAMVNERPFKYWPVKDVQIRLNDDGTSEVSGVGIRDNIVGFAEIIGVSEEVTSKVVKLVPPSSSFYLKADASMKDNAVAKLDIQSFKIGHISIPVNTLLSKNDLIDKAYADAITDELEKYEGKKSILVEWINSVFGNIEGFYAKSATVENSQIKFNGSVPEKDYTLR